MTKKEQRKAFSVLTKAIHAKSRKLLKQGLYESSKFQESYYIRHLRDIGCWLEIVK